MALAVGAILGLGDLDKTHGRQGLKYCSANVYDKIYVMHIRRVECCIIKTINS